MSIDKEKAMFRALDKWFLTEQGACISHVFLDEITTFKDLLFGETLLQLGSCGQNVLFHALRYQRKWLASSMPAAEVKLITRLNQLPLDSESVDCVLAPLTVHAFTEDRSPIDEIDRVLKPLGYIVFFGVNPWSLWGYWLHVSRNNCFGGIRGCRQSLLSLKWAMMHRGYIQHHLSSFYYIPPVSSSYSRNALAFLNEVGKMVSPMPGGFYCLVVQKYQEGYLPPTPIKFQKGYGLGELQAVG